jgi:DHA1 family inner membrane transport protein
MNASIDQPTRQNPPAVVSILSLTLCAFSVTTAEFVIAGILPEVASGLSVSIPEAGHLVTAYAIGMIIGGPLVTLLTARLPRKPLAIALLLTFFLANLATAAALDYYFVLAARLISGLVVSTFFALAIVTAASLAGPGRQAAAIAMVAMGFNLAMILGAPLGTVIGQQAGWRATFLTISVLVAAAVLFLARLVPMRHAPGPGSVVGELRVLRNPHFLLALTVTAIGNAGALMVFIYLSPLLTENAGVASTWIPALLMVYGLGATLGNLAGGWLADKALMPSIVGLLCGLAASLLVLPIAFVSPVATGVAVFVTGAFAYSVIPGLQTRVLGTARAAPTLGIALNASSFQIAAGMSAWLGGDIIARGPGLEALPLAGALLATLGACVGIFSWLYQRAARPDRPA